MDRSFGSEIINSTHHCSIGIDNKLISQVIGVPTPRGPAYHEPRERRETIDGEVKQAWRIIWPDPDQFQTIRIRIAHKNLPKP